MKVPPRRLERDRRTCYVHGVRWRFPLGGTDGPPAGRSVRLPSRRRATLALLASIGGHLALLFLLLRVAPPPQPPIFLIPPTIELEIERNVVPAPPSSGGGGSRPSGAAKEGTRGKQAGAPSTRAIAPRPSSTSEAEGLPLAPVPEARRFDLSIPDRAGSGNVRDPGGLTVRNDGAPRLQLDAAAATRATERRIQGWVAESQAVARASTGMVDPYFSSLSGELRDALVLATSGHERELQPGILAGWSASAERYGATGTPAEGEVLGRSAIVEIRLHADGSLKASLLVHGSGDSRFDRLVLASVPLALHHLPPPSLDGGLGVHGFGSRSLWAFEEELPVPDDPISFLLPVVKRALGGAGPLILEVRLLEVY